MKAHSRGPVDVGTLDSGHHGAIPERFEFKFADMSHARSVQ